MKLDETRIREFAELWKDEFGESLTPEAAQHTASQFMELYYLLSQFDEKTGTATQCDTLSTAENPPKTRISKSSPLSPSAEKLNG